MSAEIVDIGCITKLDTPPKRILELAQEKDLEIVIIVGLTKDGNEYFASSCPDGGTAIYWLQRGIWSLNKIADQIAEKGLPS